MYGTAAALLFSLSVLSRFPVCRDSVAEKRMHHALGAKGEPLLRIHLKPQRLGGNVHSSCAYKRYHVVKPVSSSKVCRVFR